MHCFSFSRVYKGTCRLAMATLPYPKCVKKLSTLLNYAKKGFSRLRIGSTINATTQCYSQFPYSTAIMHDQVKSLASSEVLLGLTLLCYLQQPCKISLFAHAKAVSRQHSIFNRYSITIAVKNRNTLTK